MTARAVRSPRAEGSGTYTYDGNGLRVKKVAGSTTTVYIFSGSKVIAEYANGAAPSSPTREYVYAGGALLARIDSSGTNYYHQDHLSNRMVTNSSGGVAAIGLTQNPKTDTEEITGNLGRLNRSAVAFCRLAIRAAKFGREADLVSRAVDESPLRPNFIDAEKRGAIEGPIRIPSSSLMFFFNDLVFPRISLKSLKSQPVLFSIPTAPTKPH